MILMFRLHPRNTPSFNDATIFFSYQLFPFIFFFNINAPSVGALSKKYTIPVFFSAPISPPFPASWYNENPKFRSKPVGQEKNIEKWSL